MTEPEHTVQASEKFDGLLAKTISEAASLGSVGMSLALATGTPTPAMAAAHELRVEHIQTVLDVVDAVLAVHGLKMERTTDDVAFSVALMAIENGAKASS